MKKKTLLLIAGLAIAGTSGCMATIQPDGSVHAHYWTAPTVVVEEVRPVSGPLLIFSKPRHHHPTYRPAPTPRPVFISRRPGGNPRSKPAPLRH